MAVIAIICLIFYTLTKSLLYDVQTSFGWAILTTTEYSNFLTNAGTLYVSEPLEIFLFTKSNGHWVWNFCFLSLPLERIVFLWVRVLDLSFDLLWMLRVQIYCISQELQGSQLSESCSNLCDWLNTIVAFYWKVLVEGYCLTPSIVTCSMTFLWSLDGGEILSLHAQSSISESYTKRKNLIVHRVNPSSLEICWEREKTTTTL